MRDDPEGEAKEPEPTPEPAPVRYPPEFLERTQELADRLRDSYESRTRGEMAEDFIAPRAVETWTKDGLVFYVTKNPVYDDVMKAERYLEETGFKRRFPFVVGPFNGYVKFPKLPGVLPGADGIYAYVPVHGGITFCQLWADGAITYGFDTGHWNSSDPRMLTIEWMREECERMARGIYIAGRFERYYLDARDSNEKKARVIERMQKFLDIHPRMNFRVMLNLLGGEL